MEVSLTVLLGLATAVLFSTYSLAARVLAVESKSPLAFSLVFGIWASILCVPFFFFTPWHFSGITTSVILITFIAMFFWGTYDVVQFYARKHVEASRFTLFFQLTPVIVLIGSIVFLGEGITIPKMIGVALVIVGNLIALYKPEGGVSKVGLVFMLFSVIAVGCAYVADKAVFQHYSLGFYAFLAFASPIVFVSAAYVVKREPWHHVLEEAKRASWRLPFLAFTAVLGYFMFLKTLEVADVSVAVPIAFTSSIFTAIGGVLLLKERGNLAQKTLGAIFVFAGVFFLA